MFYQSLFRNLLCLALCLSMMPSDLLAQRKNDKKKKDDKKKDETATLSRASLTGFASRLKALHRLSDREEAIRIAGLFITILFLIIECSPILVKLISEKSPYDQRVDTLETEYHLANLKATTLSKLATDSQLTFENKTAGFRITEMVNSENEVFAHALRQEKEQIMEKKEGWFTLLRKRRIFDF